MLVSAAAPDPDPSDPHPNGGQLRGTCPFCRSTALLVRPGHGTYHCFGCGEGGDARAFAAKIQ